MSDVVTVALITGLAATVPQALMWWQNRRRDEWERSRQEEQSTDERRAEQRAAYARCLESLADFLACDMDSWTPETRDADARMVASWSAALLVAHHAKAALVITRMLEANQQLPNLGASFAPRFQIKGLLDARTELVASAWDLRSLPVG